MAAHTVEKINSHRLDQIEDGNTLVRKSMQAPPEWKMAPRGEKY